MQAPTADKYDFLKELGISNENKGCYFNGQWCGSGEVLSSTNPSKGELLATTMGASVDEYEQAIKAMEGAKA